jgi:hypothetical protein
MADISGTVSASGVQLEAQAFGSFGAAVGSQATGTLPSIFNSAAVGLNIGAGGIGLSLSIGQDQLPEPAVWSPTPYASALASGSGGFDPKTKFLFKVTFRFIPSVAAEIASLLGLANNGIFSSDITFTVKQIDLPKYKFEYEEINYYNFRTQILKRIMHDELGFIMYDSVGNHAINFINAYLQLLVPATRQDYTTGYDLWNHGFAFTNSPQDGNDTGSRASLGSSGNAVNILDVMIIDQYYLSRDPSQGLRGANIVQAIKCNSFVFSNPKLTRFDISDADAEKGSEPNMISCGFVFDTLFMRTGQLGTQVAPVRPNLPAADLLSSVPPTSPFGTQVGTGGSINPFLSAFAGQIGKQVSIGVSGILNNAGLGNSAGGGLSVSVNGAVGTNAARTLASTGSTAPGISLPSQPILADNSTPPNQVADLSSQTASSDNAVVNS